MAETDEIQQALRRLKLRLSAGEIDEPTYQRQRDLILADLSPEGRAALGLSATPLPQATATGGVSPHPGTPTPIGPSGGSGRGLRTSIPSLADLNLQAGSILLEQWRLIRELGRGGFGAVFEAEELHLKERQAVKVLDPAMVAKEDLLARFRREVSLMRKLVHPRIVRVFDYREDPRQLVALISMELVSGGSVRQLLALARERDVGIPIPLALEILGQTLEALAEAHRQGVIHRDVTPGNVLLAGGSPEQLLQNSDRDPQVKLVDFGIAGLVERSELSQKSRVLGTAAYVAPEVLDPSVEVTPAADIYGAGAIGYELLTGKLPLGRFTEPARLRTAIAKPVNDFVLSLLEAQPTSRPAALAGAQGLQRIREGAIRREVERQESEERARHEAEAAQHRQLAAERQRQEQEAQLRERQEQERQRQAEEQRRAEEPRRQREVERAPAPQAPSQGASARQPTKRGLTRGAWAGLAILIVAVVAAIGWGVAQQRQAERQRVEAQQVREQERQQVAAAAAAGIRWVRIPSGSFTMGCSSGDTTCFETNSPTHRVTISRDFAMAETETSVAQYQACVSSGHCTLHPGSQGGNDHPMVWVDWDQSKAFCEWAGGRLPSEAEWEYAARGGREGWKFPWGDSISHENANYNGIDGRDQWAKTSPVKSFAANGYGLYDMAGNVLEWVSDSWHDSYLGAPGDGSSWSSGGDASQRVLRGGNWFSDPWLLQVSFRQNTYPSYRNSVGGFRCARTEIP